MTILVRHWFEVAALMGNRCWLFRFLFLFLLVFKTLHRLFGIFEDEVTILVALHFEVAIFLRRLF